MVRLGVPYVCCNAEYPIMLRSDRRFTLRTRSFRVRSDQMPTSLLINAKWRCHRRQTGVQRYASGLLSAMHMSGLSFETAEPDRAGRLSSTLWEQRTLPRIARSYDTLLCPANMAPVHLASETSLIAIIHCLRYRFHPCSYPKSFVRWYERMIPKIIDRADRLLTVSEAQKTEIESVYPQAMGKLGVLYPGLDRRFHPGQGRDVEAPSGQYFVCVTNSTPAKNLSAVLRAYAQVAHLPPLVVIGLTGQEADVMCPAGTRSRVRAMGHLNDQSRIAALLAHAHAAVCPSTYESFGLPCLEAMGCGTPVIASDIPAHREVCRNAAVYVETDDVAGWGERMSQMVSDERLRAQLGAEGQRRSSDFSWDRTVVNLQSELASLSTGAKV